MGLGVPSWPWGPQPGLGILARVGGLLTLREVPGWSWVLQLVFGVA